MVKSTDTMKYYYLVFLCLFQYWGFSQQNKPIAPVPLTNHSYDILFDSIKNSDPLSAQQRGYLKVFLEKAKRENNTVEIVNAYKNYLHHGTKNLQLVYADSMILTATLAKDTTLIGSSYLTKGIVYYGLKQHDKALDYYLKANELLINSSDTYLTYKTKYHLGMAKYFLGYYHEAVSLYQECLAFFKDSYPRPYLNTLHSLGLCYNQMKNYASASDINTLGLKEAKRMDMHVMDSYFKLSEGINLFDKETYIPSLKLLKASINDSIILKDSTNLSIAYFFIAKNYLEQKQSDNAIAYLLKVDRIYEDTGYLRPDLRETFELLINYYDSKNQPKEKLYYIERLLEFDDLINTYYRYLSYKIHKESIYTTQKLRQEKQKAERQLFIEKHGKRILYFALILVSILLIFIFNRHLYLKKLYKKRFEQLMAANHKLPLKKTSKEHHKKTDYQLNLEVETDLLQKLHNFEDKKRYLADDITLAKVAADFDTNTRYLSQLILKHREMRFKEYVNSLKIAHLIDLLKSNTLIRNYKYDALAKEVGFTGKQGFVAAFKANTGITPAFFIEKLSTKSTH